MFSNVPNKLITYIFEFLDLKDYRSILYVSKQFFHIINDHNKFWTRECFRQYISFDLGVYSEIYNDEVYKDCIKHQNFALPKSSWKKLLEEGIKHRNNFGDALSHIVPKDRVDNFLAYFEEILKQPPLPIASLKRETIICTTRTLFQTKLSEVLYEDSPSISQSKIFGDEYKATIDELKGKEQELLQQMAYNDKAEVLRARWYLLDSNNAEIKKATGDDFLEEFDLPEFPGLSKTYDVSNINEMNDNNLAFKDPNSLLLRIYNCLVNILTHFCGVVAEYLDCVENVYDLLTEYTARWNAYVCATLEIERLFQTFTELMNKNYESLLEGYPSYPKFSVWRLMTKIWMAQVFEKANFKLTLNESFLRVLSNHREKNIKHALNSSFENFNLDHTDKYSDLPKSLYVGLRVKGKKNSSIRYQSYDKLNNAPHVCFKEVMDLEKHLIYSFIQSILDISLNEVNIHYLNCSEIVTGYPYSELEECFLMKSNEFYNDYQQLFQESPDYFCQFLKSDFSLLCDALTERTNLKLASIQTENGLQFLKNFIHQKLSLADNGDLEKLSLLMPSFETQSNNLATLVENVFQGVIEESAHEEQKTKDFYQLPDIEAEETNCCEEKKGLEMLCQELKNDKYLVRKIIMYFEEAYPNFLPNFEFVCQRIEQFEAMRQKDSYIKEDNTSKNIPFEMGDVDTLFYDLSKNIDMNLLEKLYEDYTSFTKQQEPGLVGIQHNGIQGMEEEELPELNLHNNNNFNNQGNNGFNGFEAGIPDDFQDIDLMELPTLSLRGEHFN